MNTELLLIKLKELRKHLGSERRCGGTPNAEAATDEALHECIKLAGEQTEGEERPDMTCGTCRGRLWWQHGGYHHHGPMMERHGVVVAEPWEEAGVVAHSPKPSGLSDEEVKEILRDVMWGRQSRPEQEHVKRFIAKYGGL